LAKKNLGDPILVKIFFYIFLKMKQWVLSRHSLGLNIDCWNFFKVIDLNSNDRFFLFENIDKIDPFSCCILCINNKDKFLGYVTWDDLVKEQGKVDLYNLKQPKDILIFPWEIELLEEEERRKNTIDNNLIVFSTFEKTIPTEENYSLADHDQNDEKHILNIMIKYLKHLKFSTAQSFLPFHVELNMELFNSEEKVMKYLVENGFKDKKHWCNATGEDIQCFMKRFNFTLKDGPSIVPKIVFCVPFEQYYVGPIYYPNMITHLSWRDIPKWLIRTEQLNQQHGLFKKMYIQIETVYEGNPSNFLDGRLVEYIKEPKQKKHKNEKQSQYQDCDIEDLIENGCPMCLKNKLKEKKWYKDGERIHLYSQLRSGGISKNVANIIYERSKLYNEKAKENTWNYEHVWDKGYIGKKCDEFIANRNSDSSDVIKCPFKSKNECQKERVEKFPTLFGINEDVKYPFQQILRYFSRKKK
jgi:hypothetical protein